MTACKTHSFQYFSFLFWYTFKADQELSSKTNMVPYGLLVTAGDTPQNTPNPLFSMRVDFFAFLDQIGGKVSYILLHNSRRPLEQPRDCLVRQIWSQTLKIDFFPCRWSLECKTRSFQYFSFVFCIYIKTEQGLSSKPNMVPYGLLVTVTKTPNRLFLM